MTFIKMYLQSIPVATAASPALHVMEKDMYAVDPDGVYPVLYIPQKCTNLETNHAEADNVYIELNITSHDTEGNQMRIYSGLCNVKVVQDGETFVSDSQPLDINLPIITSDANYPVYPQSQVWIDPARSPYVYNDTEEIQDYSIYQAHSSHQAQLTHQTHSSQITVEQHNTYITQNVYSYKEPMQMQYSPISEDLDNRIRSQNECHQIDTTLYENEELECGVFLTQLPEEILNEKENRARDYIDVNGDDAVNGEDALKQLMSSEIKSSSQQKTILFLGRDSQYGQTIQKISVNDPTLECVNNGINNEVVLFESNGRNKKRYQCDKCKQLFDQLAEFKKHIVGNHKTVVESYGKAKYTCAECGKVLKSKKKFETHSQSHGNPELECQKCHKVYASKFTLKIHEKIHERQYRCNYCSKSYSDLQDLKSHVEKGHYVYCCDLCDFKTGMYTDMKSHEEQHKKIVKEIEVMEIDKEIDVTEIGHFPLSIDDQTDSGTLTSSENLIINTDEDQSKSDEIQEADSIIAKVMSNKIFHLNTKKFRRFKKYRKTCDVCSKNFDRISDLKRHLIEHVVRSTLSKTPVNTNGTLKMECVVCYEATFTKVDRYKAHLRGHANLTLYKCTLCDKSFSDSSNFSKHKKIHGSMLFKCDLCHRKFNSKKMIAQHMEYHNNNAPIKCSYCDKKFHFPSMLNKHIKSIHTKYGTRFKCTFCFIYFDTLKEKWDHEWMVHNVRKTIVDCLICGSKFRKYSELKRHCLSEHDMEIPPATTLLKRR